MPVSSRNPRSLPVVWTEAWGHYRGALERVLHAFKYERHDFFAAPLAELIEATLRARGDVAFDAVAPVPMHRSKLRRRRVTTEDLQRPEVIWVERERLLVSCNGLRILLFVDERAREIAIE